MTSKAQMLKYGKLQIKNIKNMFFRLYKNM